MRENRDKCLAEFKEKQETKDILEIFKKYEQAMEEKYGTNEGELRVRVGKPATIEQVKEAEKKLGLTFSPEYKDFLLKYGYAEVEGGHFAGLNSHYSDVVELTLQNREYNENFPKDIYVIEDLQMDEAYVGQNAKGEVFTFGLGWATKKEADSIEEAYDPGRV